MVDFAGWTMPVQYSSIIKEHESTRNAVGLFDVSHMARFYFAGSDVESFLDRVATRRIAGVKTGKIRYSLICNDAGNILDDVLIYHLSDAAGQPYWMMVANASNRAKIYDWLQQHIGEADVQINDRTVETAMIAVQGPKANAMVAAMSSLNPDSLSYYCGGSGQINGATMVVSRTGYTGEDGCEIICEAADAAELWQGLFEAAEPIGGGACGLASRDTLRLEAGMPLYGHELSEEINAGQTGLGFAIQMKDRDFIGKAAVLAGKKNGELPVRIGLQLDGRRAAREGCDIMKDGNRLGFVTSGTFSPTLQKSISMGYVDRSCAEVGTEVIVDIRGKSHPAVVVEVPFYQRAK
jgi:aminomethyltransferase